MKNNPLLDILKPRFQKLDLSTIDFDHLLRGSDLKQVNEFGEDALTRAIRTHHQYNLRLSSDQWDYLLINSDLTRESQQGASTFWVYMVHRESQKIDLTQSQRNLLLEASLNCGFSVLAQTRILDGFFGTDRQKNQQLFSEKQLDRLVDRFTLQMELLNLPGFLINEKHYLDYCVEKEKRQLSMTTPQSNKAPPSAFKV